MKWMVLVLVAAFIATLFALTRYSLQLAYVSPDATQAVLIESRQLIASEDTRRLRISLIDLVDGKVIAKTRHDVPVLFLQRFLGMPDIDPDSVCVEWLDDGAVNISIANRGCAVRLAR